MGNFKSKLASYMSKEFRMEIFEGRVRLQLPNDWAPLKTTIVDIGDDYVELQSSRNDFKTKKIIVPLNLVVIEDNNG